jgi:hypothetical protein
MVGPSQDQAWNIIQEACRLDMATNGGAVRSARLCPQPLKAARCIPARQGPKLVAKAIRRWVAAESSRTHHHAVKTPKPRVLRASQRAAHA